MFMVYVWLGIIFVSLLVEAMSAGTLISVWLAVGAVIPLIMGFWGIVTPTYIAIQIAIFGVVTTLCLVFLRKIAKKLLFRNAKDKTNLDLVVGKKMKITAEYNNIPYIRFNGIEYSAFTEDENIDLNIGDVVEIVKFEGNKAIVKKV